MPFANCNSIAQYLAACNRQKFTGTLSVRSSEGTVWNLRLFIGRIIAEAGGVAPIARWKRHLLREAPKLDWQHYSSVLDLDKIRLEWNTELLADLLKRDSLDRRQARSVLQSCAIDVLFDIALEEERASVNLTPVPSITLIPCSQPIGDKSFMILLDTDELWETAANQLEQWVDTTGKYLSPNLVPTIVQPKLLENLVSSDIWQQFSSLMDGNRSLRDISEVLGKTVDMVYLSLCPFLLAAAISLETELDIVTELNLGIHQINPAQTVKASNSESTDSTTTPVSDPEEKASDDALVEVSIESSNLSRNVSSQKLSRKTVQASFPKSDTNSGGSDNYLLEVSEGEDIEASASENSTFSLNAEFVPAPQPAIAYIDNSSTGSEHMQSVLSILGFTRFIRINKPTMAIAALLDSPPDLIFLDLEDACDLCIRIRRLSPLKHIPVTIVSQRDGVLERFRAKLAGAFGFLSKPVAEDDVAHIFHRYYSTSTMMT